MDNGESARKAGPIHSSCMRRPMAVFAKGPPIGNVPKFRSSECLIDAENVVTVEQSRERNDVVNMQGHTTIPPAPEATFNASVSISKEDCISPESIFSTSPQQVGNGRLPPFPVWVPRTVHCRVFNYVVAPFPKISRMSPRHKAAVVISSFGGPVPSSSLKDSLDTGSNFDTESNQSDSHTWGRNSITSSKIIHGLPRFIALANIFRHMSKFLHSHITKHSSVRPFLGLRVRGWRSGSTRAWRLVPRSSASLPGSCGYLFESLPYRNSTSIRVSCQAERNGCFAPDADAKRNNRHNRVQY